MRRTRDRMKSTVFGLAASTALLLTACGQPEAVERPDPVRPAKLLEISSASNVRQINLPAVIEAASSADVTFQVGGALDELPVSSGQEVSRGDVLARLNQRDFRNQVQQAQSQFNSAQAEFERAERLIAENAISRSVFEQRQAARDVASAALDSARKALDDTTLRSPFDGVVATVHADQFQNVAPQEKIVTIQTTGAAEALVQLPATLVAFSGRITPLETSVVLDVAPEQPVPAEILSASTQADPTTQTYAVRFGFTPPEGLTILPGMTGTLRAALEVVGANNSVEQITVPLAAVMSDGNQQYVWVVDLDTMTVSRRAVELEEGIGENLIVRSGLAIGETIVGAGASYLFDGMQIRPYEE